MYRKSASDSAVLHPPCSRMGFLCMEDVWMQCPSAPQPYGPRSSTYTTAHWHLAIGTLHLTAVTTGHLNEAGWRQHLQSTLGISKHYVIIYHRDLGIHWEMPFHQPLLQLHSARSSAQAPSSHPNARGNQQPSQEGGSPICYQAMGGTSQSTSTDQPICPHLS